MNDQPAPGIESISRALLSVSDKSGLLELAKALQEHGIEILSTGGSAAALTDAEIPVTEVSAYTGFPEIMAGRVKTLHPKIHGGILGRRARVEDQHAMTAHGIVPIDLVVVNLYPFAETVARDPDYDVAIENIDIGGPALIRAAAKNHAHVVVLTDPADYPALIDALAQHDGGTAYEFRRRMAAKAYGHTAHYDSMINRWFAERTGGGFPHYLTVSGELVRTLRYGENPHQRAALYGSATQARGAARAHQVQGKQLSYNNLNDADAAWRLVEDVATPTVAIIKHANPCGVATGADDAEDRDLVACYRAALACDPVSAFGGVIAVNRPLDEALAAAITEIFTELVIAPAADDAALSMFAAKKNLRLLLTGEAPTTAPSQRVNQLADGYLLQDDDAGAEGELTVVTERAPSDKELADMRFAFQVAKHVKSNAIVYVRDLATVGIGAGQISRVDAARIAAIKAADAAGAAGRDAPLTHGSVVASDAFFPFADGLLTAVDAGATGVIQPGGSMRDEEVIAAANRAGIAMVFTGVRHFRH